VGSDNGYRQQLARVEPADSAERSRMAAIEHEIGSIDWIRQRVYPRLRQELATRDSHVPAPQHLVVAGDRPRLVGYRWIAHVPGDAVAVFGYELPIEHLSGALLAQVLHTVDLGSDLRVSIAEENSPQDGRARNHPGAAIADVELFPGLPHWRVTLADSRGRSLAQLVAYERWTYGALVAGMLVVMALGVVLTLRASARATELARAKADFVSNVSHELKTPLALIRMFGETLESGIVSDPEERQEFYGIIRRESERLTHLIDNVLDASRIDRGTKRYEMREHDLVETAQAALDAYRPLFERAGFTVHTTLPPVPVALAIDREAIIQSLVNLFQNVIKYSRDQRFVSVAIRTRDGTVSISVTDRGIGIPADQIDQIFEPYYRVARSEETAIAGSGLGLAIVKHAVDARRAARRSQGRSEQRDRRLQEHSRAVLRRSRDSRESTTPPRVLLSASRQAGSEGGIRGGDSRPRRPAGARGAGEEPALVACPTDRGTHCVEHRGTPNLDGPRGRCRRQAVG
jgi:signal transduction histidine kinase